MICWVVSRSRTPALSRAILSIPFRLAALAGRARHAADYVPGVNQPGNQPLPNHAPGAGKKYSHTIILLRLVTMASGTSSSCWPQRVISEGAPTQRISASIFPNWSMRSTPNRLPLSGETAILPSPTVSSSGLGATRRPAPIQRPTTRAEPGIKIVAMLVLQIA